MPDSSNSMSLIRWTNLDDPYDSGQLAANWTLVAEHDHSSGKGVQIDTAGIKSSAITSDLIANGTIINADINASAAIVDTKLATISTSGKVSNSALANSGVTQVNGTNLTLGTTGNTITAAAGTLTGSTLASGVTASSLTTVGTLASPSLTTPSISSGGANFSGTTGTTNVQASPTASGTLTLPAATDTLVGKATTDVLINKSLSDATTYIVDATDNTKKLNIDVTGTTGITGVLQTAFTTAKTIAFPDTAGTVVTTGDSATVSTTMLSTTGVSAGTYDQVTVDTKGRVTAGANIAYGASLPVSPSVGDEYYYTADPTNGVIWHLRYSGPTNKWEFLGGAPLAVVQNSGTSSTLTSTTYVYDVTTIDGPSLTVPLTGTYRMEFGFDAANTNAARTMGMGLFTSSTANTGLITGAELQVTNADTSVFYTVSKFVHYFSLTAGTIYAQFKTSANTATVSNRWISIIPSKLG
jgi:hypothetical protein